MRWLNMFWKMRNIYIKECITSFWLASNLKNNQTPVQISMKETVLQYLPFVIFLWLSFFFFFASSTEEQWLTWIGIFSKKTKRLCLSVHECFSIYWDMPVPKYPEFSPPVFLIPLILLTPGGDIYIYLPIASGLVLNVVQRNWSSIISKLLECIGTERTLGHGPGMKQWFLSLFLRQMQSKFQQRNFWETTHSEYRGVFFRVGSKK